MIANSLMIHNKKEIENLIIESINIGLLAGKINQKDEYFEVKSSLNRDVDPNSYDLLIEKYKNWHFIVCLIYSSQHLDSVISDLSTQSDDISRSILEYKDQQVIFDALMNEKK